MKKDLIISKWKFDFDGDEKSRNEDQTPVTSPTSFWNKEQDCNQWFWSEAWSIIHGRSQFYMTYLQSNALDWKITKLDQFYCYIIIIILINI